MDSFGDGSLLVRAINSISASHIQLTPLFTTIKYELRISYGGNAVIYEDGGSAAPDLLRRNDELGRRQTERLVRFPSSSSKKKKKTKTKSPSNISSDSGAQLWPLSLNSPHSSALKGPVSSSHGQLSLNTRAGLTSMKLEIVHSIRRVHEVGFHTEFQDFRYGHKMKSDKSNGVLY